MCRVHPHAPRASASLVPGEHGALPALANLLEAHATMTSSGTHASGSMRFQLHEVLSGMLASISANSFTDDPARLAAMFESLSGQFALFAPFQSGVDADAVDAALQKLAQQHVIEHGDGGYTVTAEGLAHCVSSKRTLFNQGDREQLEAAAVVFDTL